MSWAEAGRHVARFPEAVLNALDGDGAPVSVRQIAPRYDAATGEMPLVVPDALDVRAGKASLLWHSHDEKMWTLRAILLRGRVERRDQGWVFVTESFTPPSTWRMLGEMRRAARKYLETRGLTPPPVAWDAIAAMWREAKQIPDP